MNLSSILPSEFLEPNLRLYSFIFLMALASFALISFPVKPFKGYVDPFYSPTVLVIPLVGLFRLTCYAYRKDYNRHLFRHPLSCPIPERSDSSSRQYTGETSTLFKAENYHRYFVYTALLILPFFYYDLYLSLTYAAGITIRLGSIIMLVNALALTAYTLSCHSVRSLIGGRDDCFSCMKLAKQRKGAYDIQSALNANHEKFAWLSLATVVFTDIFIRAISSGIRIDMVLVHVIL